MNTIKSNRTEWKTRHFFTGDIGERLCIQLAEFLNEHQIKDFKIIVQNDQYLEIIYRTQESNE